MPVVPFVAMPLLLVVRPGAPFVASDRSVRSDARSPVRSDALVPTSFLLLLVRHLLLLAWHLLLHPLTSSYRDKKRVLRGGAWRFGIFARAPASQCIAHRLGSFLRE